MIASPVQSDLRRNRSGDVRKTTVAYSIFGKGVDRAAEVRVAVLSPGSPRTGLRPWGGKERPLLTDLSGPQYYRKCFKDARQSNARFSVPIRCGFDLYSMRRANTSEDEIDPGEKILSVVVRAQLSCQAACERILLRIELRPSR